MAQNANISRLPIQSLLAQLSAADFDITAHEWYRTELALAKHPQLLLSKSGQQQLGHILGPLLCKNEREQVLFQEIYQKFLQSLQDGVPEKIPLDETVKAPKRAPWWLPAALALAFVAIFYLGLDWYKNKYGEARKSDRFQYEVIGDLDHFKLGDTLQLLNKTALQDTADHSFHWYVMDQENQEIWSYKGFEFRNFVLRNPNKFDHQLRFIVRKQRDSTQVFSAPVQNFRINCAQAPIIKDLIKISGEQKVGEALSFSVETEGDNFTYRWQLEGDSILNTANPSWTYTEAGEYPIQLSLVDTSGQAGYCTTSTSTNLKIIDDQPKPTFVNLPNLTLQKDLQNQEYLFPVWVYVLLGLLPILAALFWLLWQWQRKRYQQRQTALRKAKLEQMQVSDQAPYQIPFSQNATQIQKGSLPFQIANVLRRRQEGTRQLLDIPNTIQQTVAGGGFLDLQFRMNTRPTDYLFLIDQASTESHLARLFLYLTQTLCDQDVHVDYWTYRGTFDRFWNPAHKGFLTLVDIQKAFGDRKLIIFGDAEQLLDNYRAQDQLDTFSKWKHRILVTPRPLNSWSSKEKRLYQYFPVFPADLQSLMAAAELIEQEWEAEDLPAYFSDWKQQIYRKLPEDPDSEMRLRRWPQYREYLEQHPQLLPWLKSLVVHPELRWNLTIALGKAIGAPVTFDNLLILSRIPAFTTGAFPVKVWREIWSQLDLEQEWRARRALKAELQAISAEAVKGSYAEQQLETDLDIHNFALNPYQEDNQEAIRLRLAAGQVDKLRLEELDLVIERQTDTSSSVSERGAPTQAFLQEQEKPVKAPLLTPYFWLATVFSLLSLAFLIPAIFIDQQALGQYFMDKNERLPFYIDSQVKEAQRLNNLAVDNLYTNSQDETFEQIAQRSTNYLQQAINLDFNYLPAKDNFVKLAYLLGRNSYQKLEKRPEEETKTYDYFNSVLNAPWEEEESDSLNFYALHGLASLQHSLLRPDSACFFVDTMRVKHLEQMAVWGMDMPYLGACQEEKLLEEVSEETAATVAPPVEPFKVYALPNTLYSPADNSFSENLINSLSQVGRNTTLIDWSIDFNNRYNNTLKFDGGIGPDESQPVFNQSPRVGNSTAVLLYANNYSNYPDLKFPLANAQRMDNALTRIGFRTQTQEIRDVRAFDQVIDNLRSRNFGPQDQLIIYISAYFYFRGEDDRYTVPEQLIPTNGSLNEPGSGIFQEEFNARIAQISCKRILVIIDPFEIENPNIQSEKPPITVADNFAQVTMNIGDRTQMISSGFIIDELEDQLIVVAPYTRPSAQDLKLFGPSYKIKLDRFPTAFDADIIKEYEQEGIAFFQAKNTEQYQWESDFYYSDLKRGQQVDIALKDPSKQGLPPEGQITELNDESFSVRLNNPSNSDNIILVEGKIAGLTTTPSNGNNTVTGQRFDNILSLWENTMITDLDRIVPPETDLPGMVFVQGGTFQMGDQFGDGRENERPVRSVTLRDFYISDHEVTFTEYDKYCQAEGIDLPSDRGWGRGNRPVINVSWNDAVKFCNWKSEQDGLQKVYTITPKGDNVTADWTANGYRLPTEAEWEYAARERGRKVRFGNGKDIADPAEMNFNALKDYNEPYSVVGEYRVKTTDVGTFVPNSLGLYDMSGNVFEWCWDWYGSNYYASVNSSDNPRGPIQGSIRVGRGGAWPYNGACRTAFRGAYDPKGSGHDLGFRLASSLR